MNLNQLSTEMRKISNSIADVLSASKVNVYFDLSGIDDYEEATDNPDQLQLLDEYLTILNKLEDVKIRIRNLNEPVRAEGFLKKKSNGRYELEGYELTSGCFIEYLCTDSDRYYDCDNDIYKPYWVASSIEHNGSDYFIVGCKSKITDVKVRIRWRV